MARTWYVLVHAVDEKGCTITLKNRQIIFDESKIIVRGSEDQDGGKEYDCSNILYRKQPAPAKKDDYTKFQIELVGLKTKRLSVTVRKEEYEYALIFADSFNRFAEANEDKMAKPAKKTTNVPRLNESTSVTPSENRNRPEQNTMRVSTMISTTIPSTSQPRKSILSPKPPPKSTPLNCQRSVGTAQTTPSRNQNSVLCNLKNNDSPSTSKQRPQTSSPAEQTQSSGALAYRQLENIGNSCYLNASMQALSSCPSIVSRCTQLWRYMKPYALTVNQLGIEVQLLYRCLRVINNLCDEKQRALDKYVLKEFRETFGNFKPYFKNERQQDAQEFLTFIFDAMDKSLKSQDNLAYLSGRALRMYHASLPALNPLLAMRHLVELCKTCQNCNEHSYNSDTREMSVLGFNSQKRDVIQLSDLIESDFEPKGVQMKCSKCNCDRAFTRGRFIEFPQCLIFHLERSIHKENSRVYKDDRRVDIPMKLDLSKFSSFVENVGFDKGSKHSRRLFFDKSLPNSPVKNTHNGYETAPRILGGAEENAAEYEDIMFDSEIINHSLYFTPLSSSRALIKVLSELAIECNKDRLMLHFQKLKTIETKRMEKNDPPTGTIDIETDGNCFFRAVCWCLTGVEKYHKEIRKATVEYLEKNKDELQKYCIDKNYEEHIEEMKEDGAWATNCEIAAISNMLSINVYTYLSDGWLCQSPSKHSVQVGSIYLNNTSEHYEPVISVESKRVDTGARRAKKRSASDSGDEGSSRGKSDETTSETSAETPRSRTHLKRRCTERKTEAQNTRTAHPVVYQLVAVICHRGSSAVKGHYTALTKDLYKNEWIMCDDAKIESIDETSVLEKAGSEGYLLFYDRQ